MRTFYTLFIATDANATPYAACYVQVPCACVEKFQATPSARALGLSGLEQGGVFSKSTVIYQQYILGNDPVQSWQTDANVSEEPTASDNTTVFISTGVRASDLA